MLQIAISTLLVWITMKVLERRKDSAIDGFVSLTFVLVPAGLIWIIAIFTSPMDLYAYIALPLSLLYVFVPGVMLKRGFSFSLKRAVSYGLVVFLIVSVVDTVFYLAFVDGGA